MKKAYGYIRLLPRDQNEKGRLAKLVESGVPENQIYIEKISNTNSECPSFRRLLKS